MLDEFFAGQLTDWVTAGLQVLGLLILFKHSLQKVLLLVLVCRISIRSTNLCTILFHFIIRTDSGYMARIAVVMDSRIMEFFGLKRKSVYSDDYRFWM